LRISVTYLKRAEVLRRSETRLYLKQDYFLFRIHMLTLTFLVIYFRNQYIIQNNVLYMYIVLSCCIRCGHDEERILDVVPRGTELGTQVKTDSLAGRTHSQ